MYSHTDIIELTKCLDDPRHFMEQYCFTQNPVTGVTRMALNHHQLGWLDMIKRHRLVAIGEERQSGKTQLIAAQALYDTLFNPNYVTIILAPKQAFLQEIRGRITYMHEMLPRKFAVEIRRNYTSSIELENGSKVIFEPISQHCGKGRTANKIFIDGFELLKNNEQRALLGDLMAESIIYTGRPYGCD